MALISDDQKPLPLPVKGSIPECMAWAGIAEVILRANVEKEREGCQGTNVGFFHRCLARETSSWRLLCSIMMGQDPSQPGRSRVTRHFQAGPGVSL